MNPTSIAGPAPEVSAQLHAWGEAATPPQVQAFYAARQRVPSGMGVCVHKDLAYGPHERHRLDLYVPATPGQGRPMLLFLHGGGFIRGDKSERAHIGWWGARQGFVTALANYRLAPQAQWPSGAEDAAAASRWLQAHGPGHGGDPLALVMAGESAGAAHVAAASLIQAMLPATGLAGVFLLSGPYDAWLERLARRSLGIATPDPRNDAYFGVEPADWAEVRIIERIDVPPLPVTVALSARDLPQMQVQAGALFSRLVTVHGFEPNWLVVPEHNHFSACFSVGTEDESLSAPLAAFVWACSRRHPGRVASQT